MPVSVMNFDETLAKVDAALTDFQTRVDSITTNAERWAPWLQPVADWMSEAIDWLKVNVPKLLSEIGKFFTRPGHPVALWENGNRWVAEVGKRAGDQVGVITGGFMNADDKWKGDAADAYLKAFPLQSAAAAQVFAVCEKMQGSLHNLALGIGGLWLGTLVALAKVIAELIPESAATAVPPTAPAGLAAAVGSVASFIALWGTVVFGFYQYVTSLFEEQTALTNQLNNNQAFPGPPAGTWPQSTTEDFSDGTFSDGDKSDWQLRY